MSEPNDYDDEQLFESYCRMTCLSGSERGRCPCKNPKECKLQEHPDYAAHREQASTMMGLMIQADPHRKE
jgi:hypothetical protein